MDTRNHARSPSKQGFSVALPKTMLRKIEQIAARECRTRNNQIEFLLRFAIEEWEKIYEQRLQATQSTRKNSHNVTVTGSHNVISGRDNAPPAH